MVFWDLSPTMVVYMEPLGRVSGTRYVGLSGLGMLGFRVCGLSGFEVSRDVGFGV